VIAADFKIKTIEYDLPTQHLIIHMTTCADSEFELSFEKQDAESPYLMHYSLSKKASTKPICTTQSEVAYHIAFPPAPDMQKVVIEGVKLSDPMCKGYDSAGKMWEIAVNSGLTTSCAAKTATQKAADAAFILACQKIGGKTMTCPCDNKLCSVKTTK
jgi:hypothetical protein